MDNDANFPIEYRTWHDLLPTHGRPAHDSDVSAGKWRLSTSKGHALPVATWCAADMWCAKIGDAETICDEEGDVWLKFVAETWPRLEAFSQEDWQRAVDTGEWPDAGSKAPYKVVEIPIERIARRIDSRALRAATVDALVLSIGQLGLLHPIHVRPCKVTNFGREVDGWQICAGGHRLEAMKRLGWTSVPCIIIEDDDTYAEMVLIDENLARSELAPSSRSWQVERRAMIEALLRQSPEKSDRAIAEALGVSPTTVGSVRSSTSTVQTGRFEKRIGKDGKARKQPAKNRLEDRSDVSPSGQVSNAAINAVIRSLQFVAAFERYAEELAEKDLDTLLAGLVENERARIRTAIDTINAHHGRIIARI